MTERRMRDSFEQLCEAKCLHWNRCENNICWFLLRRILSKPVRWYVLLRLWVCMSKLQRRYSESDLWAMC